MTDKAGVKIDMRPPADELADHCHQESRTRMRCSLFEPGGIRVGLGGGDDTIRIESSRAAPVVVEGESGNDGVRVTSTSVREARLQGGPGDDLLYAPHTDDFLHGGRGADQLYGNGGSDELTANEGSDRLWGGSGDDRLNAESNDRDRVLDCGAGSDLFRRDLGIDPAPRRCEHELSGD